MEIDNALSGFLTEVGYPNRIEERLCPIRILLDPINGLSLAVSICDGELCLEDLTAVVDGFKELVRLPLAEPDSFDDLVVQIGLYCGGG